MNKEAMRRLQDAGFEVHIVKVVRLSKHDVEKLGKPLSFGQDPHVVPVEDLGGGGWPCFKGCLNDWGVPANAIYACTVACGAGPALCIGCLGVSEYIVLGCAMYCAWAPLLTDNLPLTPSKHHLRHAQTRSTQQAKLSPRAVGVASLR
jgi:hypothetical protein